MAHVPDIALVSLGTTLGLRRADEAVAELVLEAGATATEDEIREFCRGQIAHHKIPRYVRFVKELPKTVTGKAQKFAMREAMMRELGLTEARTA